MMIFTEHVIVDGFEAYRSEEGFLSLYRLLPSFEGTTVITPSNTKRLGWECFRDCRAQNVILNVGLEHISREAFYSCGDVRRVWIPATVTEVETDGLTWSTWQWALELFFEDQPRPEWRQEYDEPITAPNPENFHRSSGSWDDENILTGTRHVVKDYKSPRSVVHTHVSLQRFKEICKC